MPLFHFHVTHEGPRVEDTERVLLADRKAAWDEAIRMCGEMMREIDGNLAVGSEWRIDVSDQTGPLFTITFGAHDTGLG